MFPVGLLGGLISAIPSTYKLVQGLNQQQQATQGLAGLERPEYEIPEEQLRSLSLAQMRYGDSFMPGQGVYTDRIEQQAANAFSQSSEAGNPFAAITNIQAQSSSQLQDMQIRAMQMQMQNEQVYRQALSQMSGFKEKEFQFNEFAPYQDKYREYRDMLGAGKKNTYGALDSMAGMATGLLGTMGGSALGGSSGQQNLDQSMLDEYMNTRNGSSDPLHSDVVDDIIKELLGAQQGDFADPLGSMYTDLFRNLDIGNINKGRF